MRYLLQGFTERSVRSDPSIVFLGTKQECIEEMQKQDGCLWYAFNNVTEPDWRKEKPAGAATPPKKQRTKRTSD